MHLLPGSMPALFPICMGVFLYEHGTVYAELTLPHVHGGVSVGTATSIDVQVLFPICMGVFPDVSFLRWLIF